MSQGGRLIRSSFTASESLSMEDVVSRKEMEQKFTTLEPGSLGHNQYLPWNQGHDQDQEVGDVILAAEFDHTCCWRVLMNPCHRESEMAVDDSTRTALHGSKRVEVSG